MVELIIHSGKHQGKRLSIPAAEVFVGRDDDCQIRLASTDVSRRHCVLKVADGAVCVRDLESRNGTFVNDMPISGDVVLKPGDILRIGPMVFQLPGTQLAGTQPAATKSAAPPETDEVPVAAAPKAEPARAADAPRRASVPVKAAAAAAPAKPGKSEKATDDDIASWLTDSDNEHQENSGDTTIISGRSAKKPDASPVSAPLSPEPKADKKQFRNIAEEAGDIIRRHWESMKKKGAP